MSSSERKLPQQSLSKSVKVCKELVSKFDRNTSNQSTNGIQRSLPFKETSHISRCGSQPRNISYDSNRRCNTSIKQSYKQQKRSPFTNTESPNDEEGSGQQVVSADEVSQADLGSLFRPGLKKGGEFRHQFDLGYNFDSGLRNRNHSRFSGFSNNGGRKTSKNQRFQNPYLQSFYNKEQFLLANCQFVVKCGFDYSVHMSNPDLLVDWDLIEEVRLFQTEQASCPICLYPPMAARITRCGHVFCWPCILHYLSLSDDRWRKCPICFESVNKEQLRSAFILPPASACVEKSHIRLTLMRRERGCNFVAPAAAHLSIGDGPKFRSVEDSFSCYSKLLLTTQNNDISFVIKRERGELMMRLAEDEHAPENCFVFEALEALKLREMTLNESDENEPVFGDDFKKLKTNNILDGTSLNQRCYTDSTKGVGQTNKHDNVYYFYQADDGQPIFLHPLNVHCLLREYGSLDKAPAHVEGTVTQIDTFTMCTDTRNRYRYLSHLPLTSVFCLVELELSPDMALVSPETLYFFDAEFAKRRQTRAQKLQKEQQQQKRCQRWEKAMLLNASYSSFDTTPHSSSTCDDDYFPISTFVQSAQREIEAGLLTTSLWSSTSPSVDNLPIEHSLSSVDAGFQAVGEEVAVKTPSFAQMLKCGKPKQTPALSATHIDTVTDDECPYASLALATYRHEFSDALEAAFNSFSLPSTSGDTSAVSSDSKTNNKKKKKGQILFTL